MAWEKVAKCDICGAVKGSANKWLLARSDNYRNVEASNFAIFHWNDELSLQEDIQLVCSETCLHRLLQPFLDSRSKI